MPSFARGEYFDTGEIQIVNGVHCRARRAFLCGQGPMTGQSFEHRREWIRARQEFVGVGVWDQLFNLCHHVESLACCAEKPSRYG